MTEYHVEYRIEVDAASPEEAALAVADILAGAGGRRGVYHVREHVDGSDEVEVDLSLVQCSNCQRTVHDGAEVGYGEAGDLCYECNMRAEGYVECPQCDQWVEANEVHEYNSSNGPIKMCQSCMHDARRSGWNEGD